METLIILGILAILIIKEKVQEHNASEFSNWMLKHGPDRHMTSAEIRNWYDIYKNSKK